MPTTRGTMEEMPDLEDDEGSADSGEMDALD